MDIHCTYQDHIFDTDETFYRCVISKQPIPEEIFKLVGTHKEDKTNDDVTYIEFRYCTVTKVPQGLTKIFPNLKFLEIFESQLHTITKADLIEYQNLEKFICRNNLVEFLPGDLFEGFQNLQFISFNGNKLQIVQPNILDGLDNIKHVDFWRNSNYDKCYSIYNNTNANATLDEVHAQLFEKFFSSDPENVKNFIDKPHQPMVKIFKELQQLKKAEIKLNQVVEDLMKDLETIKLEKLSMEKNLQEQIDKLSEQMNGGKSEDVKDVEDIEGIKDVKDVEEVAVVEENERL
ncbi:hypothetical protein ACKWTF_015316 [Chironomus riparius]